MKLSKIEAAQRQLDCAIRLYLADEDLSSIVTLSRAAFRLLWDLYPTMVTDGFEKSLSGVISRIGWSRFNHIANFLKHADKDPQAQMEPHDVHVKTGIGLSVILFGRLTESELSPEMKAWESMMTLEQPDVWDSHPDPSHSGYGDFLRLLSEYRAATREQRLSMVRAFLVGFKSMEQGLDPLE